jgi:DNA-binding NtrC family response regulator
MTAMKKILLVDDETFFLQVLNRALQSPSTEVKTVETGKAALQEVAATPYHLCFLDICLPDLDGTEVLKRIAEISPKTKVIMMTAGDVTDNMQQVIEKYAYMFLTKPFDLIQLRLLTKSIPEEAAT